ncbi:glycoside hydrolase 15-like protein [Halogranum salarium B-1]|uniref:Glycoside hydrolase 15-like protein n=1 Tax=Halogranum salarium B-1 TaxID=1210908 RepID=J3JDI2_9EURY|nr:glycoside hydrolase 15-like protein [Halogranum salarium B-1]
MGNLEIAALVAPDGSIDWFPVPHVDSSSIFAAILNVYSHNTVVRQTQYSEVAHEDTRLPTPTH